MIYPEKTFDIKGGQVVLRSPREEDAAALLRYLSETAAETTFLLREPDEMTFDEEGERKLLRGIVENPRQLMLLALVDGELAGNASVNPLSNKRRLLHRCGMGIALYQKFWGRGIGRLLFTELLAQAKAVGYEQAELEVAAGNERARGLYESLGFQVYGRFPDNMKYSDGSYTDTLWMMRKL